MTMHRWTVCFAFLAGAAPAVAQVAPAEPVATVCGPFENSCFQEVFSRLAGEWEGNVQTRRGSRTSVSSVWASNRNENNGTQLASCITGYSFGASFSGASVFTLGDNGATPGFAVVNTQDHPASFGSFALNANNDGLVFWFEGTDPASGKPARFQQVVRSADLDHLTIECWSFEDSGAKTQVFSMDLTRIPKGAVSAAASGFTGGPALAKARQSLESFAAVTSDDLP